MDLKIKDVADMLHVSESTIRGWIVEGNIPHYRMNQHYYFSRNEIENWVISHQFDKTHENSPFTRKKEKEFATSEVPATGGIKQFSLLRAIHKGDVLHHIAGKNKEELIRNTIKKTAKQLHVDADAITEMLLDREKMMPTALNNGIAVPHTRDFLLNTHQDAVIVVFAEEPLEYGALDGIPVHTLFFLFACEDKRHLHLLAKIAHLSHQSAALNLFQQKPSKEQFLAFVKEWEAGVPKVKVD